MHLDKELLDQVVTVGEKTYHFSDLFTIDQQAVSDEFANQAARYAYLGMQCAKAEVLVEEAEAERDKVYATLDSEVRKEYDNAKEKYTEAKVKSEIILDEAYQTADSDWRACLLNYKYLKAMVDALRQRGDMLVSLGAMLRQENEMTGMKINEMKDALRKSR